MPFHNLTFSPKLSREQFSLSFIISPEALADMTTSKETEWMNHPRLRKLVTSINELTLAERITLVKGLVPAIADELSDTEYERFVDAIRLKGERFHEAQSHPGEGRAERKVPGERELEGR